MNCNGCGKEILNKKKYCSKQCYDKTRSDKMYKICPACNLSFKAQRIESIYCSNKCATVSKNQSVLLEKRKKTLLKNYGVEYPSQLLSSKEKIKNHRLNGRYDNISVKMKQTKQEKYRNENYSNPEKGKQTKKEKYGNENYNNREKVRQTCLDKYGVDSWSKTNDAKEFINKRLQNNEIGFNSNSYKNYLLKNNISNVSQLQHIKDKKLVKKLGITYDTFNSRFNGLVIPLFTKEEYIGGSYEKTYKFKCIKCESEFEHYLYGGNIPRCLICFPLMHGTSKFEVEIKNFIVNELKITDMILSNTRTLKNKKELDILIPSKNLAIEFDGIYWHSEINGKKSKLYHLNKTEECIENKVSLLHIFENEWIYKQNIVKSIIQSKLGLYNKKIFARKCNIQELSIEEKDNFLIRNHIQGKDVSKVKLGLFYENELISCMTFIKSRYSKSTQWEMSRFANKTEHVIVGGASKLFNYFIKKYNPQSIITYADRRYFTGDVYTKLGFAFIENTPPSYFYFEKDQFNLQNRIKFQKHKLSKLLTEYDEKLSEWQNMQLNGYDRIWDCGHKKYVWNSDIKL